MVPLDSKQSTEHCVSLKLCYMLLSYITDLVLAVGHSIRRTEEHQSDPYRCETRQYNGGESLDTSPQSQADRLRLGHARSSSQDGHEVADSLL